MAKRLFDLFVSIAGLTVLAPLLLAIAVLVRLECAGPVLFRQARIGRHGVPFEILKFRTMYESTAIGPQLTVSGDPRITRIGRLLRATKLDELPQLVNVVRGQMSLVGPRPEVPRYIALYPPQVRDVVLSVRPGITDEASILFRNESAILAAAADPERAYIETILPQKLRIYEAYARRHGLRGDLRILLRTISAVLRS
jgi:lipopolysaccharide/colanic/teichoic acid biosynthesis glycosyltransferase